MNPVRLAVAFVGLCFWGVGSAYVTQSQVYGVTMPPGQWQTHHTKTLTNAASGQSDYTHVHPAVSKTLAYEKSNWRFVRYDNYHSKRFLFAARWDGPDRDTETKCALSSTTWGLWAYINPCTPPNKPGCKKYYTRISAGTMLGKWAGGKCQGWETEHSYPFFSGWGDGQRTFQGGDYIEHVVLGGHSTSLGWGGCGSYQCSVGSYLQMYQI